MGRPSPRTGSHPLVGEANGRFVPLLLRWASPRRAGVSGWGRGGGAAPPAAERCRAGHLYLVESGGPVLRGPVPAAGGAPRTLVPRARPCLRTPRLLTPGGRWGAGVPVTGLAGGAARHLVGVPGLARGSLRETPLRGSLAGGVPVVFKRGPLRHAPAPAPRGRVAAGNGKPGGRPCVPRGRGPPGRGVGAGWGSSRGPLFKNHCGLGGARCGDGFLVPRGAPGGMPRGFEKGLGGGAWPAPALVFRWWGKVARLCAVVFRLPAGVVLVPVPPTMFTVRASNGALRVDGPQTQPALKPEHFRTAS